MSRVTALVIDDEKSIRVSLGRALEDMGLEVLTAATGEEGIEKSGSGSFSIVMLDLKLPGIGGLEVLRQIKEHTPPPPVVIISAHGTINSAVAAMRLGAADFIQKPFSLEEVRSVVGEILTRGDLQEDATDYESLLSLARRAITRKEFDLAEAFASRAISAGVSRPEAYNLLGSLLEISGDRAKAMKFYRAALDMDPTFAPARVNFDRQ
jgi:DNA-binding NtrC family response regulator